MLTSPNLLLGPAYGVPHHIPGHNNATTPVGMYFRYRIGPLEAIDVMLMQQSQPTSVHLLSRMLTSPNLLLGPAYGVPHHIRAITMQQHPLACILDIESVH